MSVTRPARADGVEARETESGLVVRHTVTRVHRLNPSASVILELCDGSRTTDGIIELVQSLWDLEEPPREEVTACLAQLRAAGLVT